MRDSDHEDVVDASMDQENIPLAPLERKPPASASAQPAFSLINLAALSRDGHSTSIASSFVSDEIQSESSYESEPMNVAEQAPTEPQSSSSLSSACEVNVYNTVQLSDRIVITRSTPKVSTLAEYHEAVGNCAREIMEKREHEVVCCFLPCRTTLKRKNRPPSPTYKLRFKVRSNGHQSSNYRANCSIRNPNILDIDIPTVAHEKARPGVVAETRYEVERVLTSRYDEGRRRKKYLIKWIGWPMSESTWECQESLGGCQELYAEYKLRRRALKVIASRNGYQMPEFNENYFFEETSYREVNLFETQLDTVCKEFNQAKLFVENWVDSQSCPPKYEFTLENTYSEEAKTKLEAIKERFDCDCENCGSKPACCPAKNLVPFYYTKNGLQKRFLQTFDRSGNFLIECCAGCACYGRSCSNRVVQRGRQIPLVLFRTRDRGWGLFAAQKIPQGAFVTEYVGHVLRIQEALDKKCSTYAFDLDAFGRRDYTIDAENRGNEARFVNHSCEPNLTCKGVVVDFRSFAIPRMAYFALRDIEIGEELTIDYFPRGKEWSKFSGSGRLNAPKCLCGASKCRKTL
ncbi:hypothetical protein QR680_017593 [Steinernema hermaphroditum]|uniref:Histone-lysine N-methyltransferase n=1 Tax=Steinernema hermaphroditum TaxID=289476 RepID=A0AA39HH64_9BILA|nr:hypothetical protein QR680_017593 [Steinernema hermaphroditum]